jgi:hypothetical protein
MKKSFVLRLILFLGILSFNANAQAALQVKSYTGRVLAGSSIDTLKRVERVNSTMLEGSFMVATFNGRLVLEDLLGGQVIIGSETTLTIRNEIVYLEKGAIWVRDFQYPFRFEDQTELRSYNGEAFLSAPVQESDAFFVQISALGGKVLIKRPQREPEPVSPGHFVERSERTWQETKELSRQSLQAFLSYFGASPLEKSRVQALIESGEDHQERKIASKREAHFLRSEAQRVVPKKMRESRPAQKKRAQTAKWKRFLPSAGNITVETIWISPQYPPSKNPPIQHLSFDSKKTKSKEKLAAKSEAKSVEAKGAQKDQTRREQPGRLPASIAKSPIRGSTPETYKAKKWKGELVKKQKMNPKRELSSEASVKEKLKSRLKSFRNYYEDAHLDYPGKELPKTTYKKQRSPAGKSTSVDLSENY